MNKWKVSFFVVLLLGFASNAYLFYHVVDGGISYSYLHDSYTRESRRFNALGELLVAGSEDYTQADILHMLRQANKDAFIVEEDNVIHFEEIQFGFESDRLTSVD